MGFLRKYRKKYGLRFIVAIFFLSIEALADLIQPALMAQMIDKGVGSSDLSLIFRYGGFMLLITMFGAIAASIRNVLSVLVSQNFAMDLREDLYVNIQRFSMSSIDRFGSATLITRLTNDVTRVQTFVNGMMRVMMKAPLTGIGSIVMAIQINPRLSVILIALVPVIAALIALNMKFSYPLFRRVQRALDSVNRFMQDYLAGIRVVKVFNRSAFEERRFQSGNRQLGSSAIQASRVGSLFGPLINISVNGGIVAILWFGGLGVGSGTMQVGSIIAFIHYMTRILFAIMMVNNTFSMYVRARASAERIGEVMSEKSELTFPGKIDSDTVASDFKATAGPSDPRSENLTGLASAPTAKAGQLSFHHVFFSYRKKNAEAAPVLSDVHFTVAAGRTLGIIGPIGAGKSTLISLILRFYDPDRGMIMLNGKPLSAYEKNDLRKRMAIVPQQPVLFSGTIEENIRWGNPEADEQAVRKAAAAAEADAFIRNTPNGYRSAVGQGGVNLSGGQKQRIAIARALIRSPQLLILDDATSAVDAHTDRKIRDHLSQWSPHPTCLIVSQRVSSIMEADQILVMNEGKIVGRGVHQELLRTSSIYREICQAQLSAGRLREDD